MLKPLGDKVIVKSGVVEETTKSGLFIPESAKDKSSIAEIVAVGPGGNIDGKVITMEVKVGDKVVCSKYSGTEIKYDGQEYTIISQSDILAIVK